MYREGALRLDAIHVGFAGASTAEGRFAARRLSAILAGATGHAVPVSEGTPPQPAIVLERTGSLPALPARDEKPGPAARESYRISVTASGARITAPGSAGIYYGVETLRQMIEGRGAGATLPAAEVHDWPSLAYRGYMMDLSHGFLPTVEEIERQIDFLSRWKANQYYFYSEASIEMKGYPLVNPGARYSQAEVRRIIAYARARHVDVVPCVEYFGHMHDLLRVEKYADMGAIPHGGDINPRHPKTQALLQDWITQIADLFPSPWFHTGLDEPFELEIAGSATAGGVPPSQLYEEHLLNVARMVRERGKRFLFWADVHAGARIFEKYPGIIDRLPRDVVAVPWYYYVSPDFKDFFVPFAKAGLAQVAAPGINIYNDIFPDYTVMMQNIDGFVGEGRSHGAIGVMNTGWTDDAQTIYRMAWPGLAYGAIAGWQAAPIDRATFFQDYAAIVHGDAAGAEVGKALTALTASRDLYALSTGGVRDTMWRFWANPFEPARLERAKTHRADLRECRLKAEDALEALARAAEHKGDPGLLEPLRLAGAMLDYAGMKQIYALEIAGFFDRMSHNPARGERSLYLGNEISSQDHSRTADLMDAVTTLREQYRKAWLAEATEYRLGTALGRWDAEYEFWRRFQDNVRHVSRGPQSGPVPPLESLVPAR